MAGAGRPSYKDIGLCARRFRRAEADSIRRAPPRSAPREELTRSHPRQAFTPPPTPTPTCAEAETAPHARRRTPRADHQPCLPVPVRPPGLSAQQPVPGLPHAARLRHRAPRRGAARACRRRRCRPRHLHRVRRPGRQGLPPLRQPRPPAACNWMVPAPRTATTQASIPHGLVAGLCLSCSVTRTIPDLSVEGNGERWRKPGTGQAPADVATSGARPAHRHPAERSRAAAWPSIS